MVVLPAPTPSTLVPYPSPSQTGAKSSVTKQARITQSPVVAAEVSPPHTPASLAAAQEVAGIPLRIDSSILKNAVRDVNQKSVRQLALQSGQIDIFDKPVVHPIALAAAQASEPDCPAAGLLRESNGPQGYALTRDRSGDCESERAARVRARAVAR
jgi:hypothetical protein